MSKGGLVHAVPVLLGAFLLLAVQPLVGKALLPKFGGSATVWTVCLMTFQLGLLAGYGYAHLSARFLPPRVQAVLHVLLLLISLLAFPPSTMMSSVEPLVGMDPALAILRVLSVSFGVPFIVLAATSPLVSQWASQTLTQPYRLYAFSNAGSLLAVVAYPVAIEPTLSLAQQFRLWTIGFGLLAGASSIAAWWRLRAPSGAAAHNVTSAMESLRPIRYAFARWMVLAACGSALLSSTTNQLCQEVSVVPLLWIVPLALYLLTYTIWFARPHWYSRRTFTIALAMVALPQCAVLYAGARLPLFVQLSVYLLTLTIGCSLCHGELARAVPSTRRLTTFYLAIALGGAAGGAFVALAAPLLFSGYWEYHLSFFGVALLTWMAAQGDPRWSLNESFPIRAASGAGLVALAVVLIGETHYGQLRASDVKRNFFGVLRLVEGEDSLGKYRRMAYGRIDHGGQYFDPEKRFWPVLYFGRGSAVEMALQFRPVGEPAAERRRNLRVGIIGLGTGTIATYGIEGDYFRFYEINPAVIDWSRRYFTYLSDSKATIDIVLGDGRVSLEHELATDQRQDYDVLIADAFRNDAVPTHLLTVEAAGVYFQHLRPNGLLVLHTSNRFVDLPPIARGIANQFQRTAVLIESPADTQRGESASQWIVITNSDEFLQMAASHSRPWNDSDRAPRVWTDDFAAIWPVLK